jgi:RNA 2',3'-cyclic 3'-phosphodiesterase
VRNSGNMPEPAPPPHFRIFLAISLPEDVRCAIARAQEELRRALPDQAVKWTKRDQFHLTLRFLGNVASPRVGSLVDAVRLACQPFPPLRLRAEGIGFFPDLRRPRVVWVSVHDERKHLRDLHKVLEAVTNEFTAKPPEGRFTGHVTLGRAKQIKRAQAEILSKLSLSIDAQVFGDWTTAEVEIMRSELSSGGARHTCLATAPLAGNAAGLPQ